MVNSLWLSKFSINHRITRRSGDNLGRTSVVSNVNSVGGSGAAKTE